MTRPVPIADLVAYVDARRRRVRKWLSYALAEVDDLERLVSELQDRTKRLARGRRRR